MGFWVGFLGVFLVAQVLWLCGGSRFLVVRRVRVCFVFLGVRTCRVLRLFRTCVGELRAKRRLSNPF